MLSKLEQGNQAPSDVLFIVYAVFQLDNFVVLLICDFYERVSTLQCILIINGPIYKFTDFIANIEHSKLSLF